jgi:hypothetical protein
MIHEVPAAMGVRFLGQLQQGVHISCPLSAAILLPV